MSKMKKIFAVLLCVAMLMPLLPQPEAKEVEAAAGEVAIKDEKNNLFDMSKMNFPSSDASGYLQAETEIDSKRGDVTVVAGNKTYEESLKDQQFFYWSNVAWEAGVTYQISYYYKVSHTSGKTFRFYPLARIDNTVYNKNQDAAFEDAGTDHSPNTKEWTKQEITWTAPKTSTGGYSVFGFNLTLFEGDKIYLDDIVIEKAKPDFTGAQVILSDGIQMKLYINDVSDVTNGLSAKVNGKSVDILKDTEGKQYIAIPFAAKEMVDEVKTELYLDDVVVASKEYSVREYAEALLKDQTHATLWDAVKAMLNYGAWAQKYFNYKTDDLANSVVPKKDQYSSEELRETFSKDMVGNRTLVQSGFTGYRYGNSECTKYMEFSETDSFEHGEIETINGKDKSLQSYPIWLMGEVKENLTSTYIISFWLKTNKQTGSAGFSIEPTVRWYPTTAATGGGWASIPNTKCDTTTDWKKVVVVWTPPEECKGYFRVAVNLKMDKGDSVSIAGFKLERADNTASIKDYEPTIENKVNSFQGYTMVLEDTTSVRLYFNEQPTSATIDDVRADIKTKGSKYYIEIPNVKAGELDNSHTIKVTSGEQTMKITNFSVLSAATAAIQNDGTKDELKNLCTALVLYAEAAKAL